MYYVGCTGTRSKVSRAACTQLASFIRGVVGGQNGRVCVAVSLKMCISAIDQGGGGLGGCFYRVLQFTASRVAVSHQRVVIVNLL